MEAIKNYPVAAEHCTDNEHGEQALVRFFGALAPSGQVLRLKSVVKYMLRL